MELVVLGRSASYALPDEATSGYLIKSNDYSPARDMGNGCLSNLFRWQDRLTYALNDVIANSITICRTPLFKRDVLNQLFGVWQSDEFKERI